jgi:N6-adenosine-specific RNA methylase IME4
MFLWTTHKFIWDAKKLLETWGFDYRSIIVWDKEKMGMGDLFRMQCEFCLVGIKGKPLLSNPHNLRDIIREPRREHSRKPEAFYEMVDTLCKGSKVEYFARKQREGYVVYGNDTGKF